MTDDRLNELARRAAYGKIAFSKFIDPAQMPSAKDAARKNGSNVRFFGGYEYAERVVAAFDSDDCDIDFPVVCIKASWDTRYSRAEHRDILGAVMGLSIERDTTGDILVYDGYTLIFALEDVANYICANLASAGRATLKCEIFCGEIVAPEKKGTYIRVTYQSPRLDAMVSAAYDISRAAAQELIRAGHVKLNHIPVERTDAKVTEGDLLSVRGMGRAQFVKDEGLTRRGRLAAQFFKYGK